MPYNKGAWDVHTNNLGQGQGGSPAKRRVPRPRPLTGKLPGSQAGPPPRRSSPKKPWSRAGSILGKINPFD